MGVEQNQENPHIVSASIDQLRTTLQLDVDLPVMETLSSEERELLTRVVKAQTLALGLILRFKDNIQYQSWRDQLDGMLEQSAENIFNIEGQVSTSSLSAGLLNIDLTTPSTPVRLEPAQKISA